MRIEEVNFIDFIKNFFNYPICFVDVGSNTGNYAKKLEEKVNCSKVYFFEPIISLFNQLPESNKYKKYNIGLGSENKDNKFYECLDKYAHSSFVLRKHFIENNYKIIERSIPTRRLDSIIQDENIDFLKIDVEGFEFEVLKGCEELLKKEKIKFIQFEYGGCFLDSNLTLNKVIDFLKQFDYNVYHLNKNKKFIMINDFEDKYNWIHFFAYK